MISPKRPALVPVLAAMTEVPPDVLEAIAHEHYIASISDHGIAMVDFPEYRPAPGCRNGHAPLARRWRNGKWIHVPSELRRWSPRDTAGAVEALVTHDLLPPEWTDAALAPGISTGLAGDAEAPPSATAHAVVFAVASLGRPAIETAMCLANVLQRYDAADFGIDPPPLRTLFRVAPRDALVAHHHRIDTSTLDCVETVFSACIWDARKRVCPDAEPHARRLVYATWDAMCALADVGLHVLRVSPWQVQLGVESYPSKPKR